MKAVGSVRGVAKDPVATTSDLPTVIGAVDELFGPEDGLK